MKVKKGEWVTEQRLRNRFIELRNRIIKRRIKFNANYGIMTEEQRIKWQRGIARSVTELGFIEMLLKQSQKNNEGGVRWK